MKTRKLLKLADFLETVPPENFDLNEWAKSPETMINLENAHRCGTTLCVAGWAVVCDGLTILHNPHSRNQSRVLGTRDHRKLWTKPHLVKNYAAKILGLSKFEREVLFYPREQSDNPLYPYGANNNPKLVAAYIRAFVRAHDEDGYLECMDSKMEPVKQNDSDHKVSDNKVLSLTEQTK